MWHPTPKDHNLNSCNHENLTFCPQILKTSKVTASYTVMFLIKHLLICLVNCHTLLSAKNLCFSQITVNTSPCSTSGLSLSNRGTWCSGEAGGQDTAGGFVFWSLIRVHLQQPYAVQDSRKVHIEITAVSPTMLIVINILCSEIERSLVLSCSS